MSRSYYRGAAGAILVYDVASWRSFEGLRTFLDDARALASPDLTVILAGNKADVVDGVGAGGGTSGGVYGSSYGSERSEGLESMGGASEWSAADGIPPPTPSSQSSRSTSLGFSNKATVAPDGREVPADTASRWAGTNGIPVAVEVSAFSGDNVDELFERLARMILTKIELGEIDPDDPASGIQYGDIRGWGADDGSIKSGITDEGLRRRGRKKKRQHLREWEEVFRLSGSRRRGGCC